MYLIESEESQPKFAARRAIMPAGTVYDNTSYATPQRSLRPGVVISSHVFEIDTKKHWQEATAGVLVEDALGNRFLTIPTHLMKHTKSERSITLDHWKG